MAGRPSALVPYPERVRITGDGEIIVRIAWPLAMAGLLVAACGGGAGSTAEESPSVAPSGFAADAENGYPYFPASATFAAESARLVGPHYSLQVDKVTFADRFTEQQANSFADGLNRFGPLRAPSGHRFMVVKTAEPSVDPGLRVDGSRGNQSSDDLRAEVRVGQTTLQLPVRLDALLGGETFVMTVPAAGTPLLAVTDSGRTQSLDLTTGKRTADAVAGYYPVLKGDGFSASFSGIVGATLCGMGMNARRASLQPYVPGKGWARKGKAWLYFLGSVNASSSTLPGNDGFAVSLDPAASFTLKAAGGATARGQGIVNAGPLDASGAGGVADMHVYLEVPAGFRSGTLRIQPRGKFRLGGRSVSFTPRQGTKTVKIQLQP